MKNGTSKCAECGTGACVCHCSLTGGWAAHCMDCDNAIGAIGYYDPCAESEEEAILLWNELNYKLLKKKTALIEGVTVSWG